MGTYPPTLQELKNRLAIYPFLPQLSDDQYEVYLEMAKAKVEMRIPQLRYGVSADVSQQAWMVCLNLATVYIRMDIERTPDSAIPPALLQTLSLCERDLEDLAQYVWQRASLYETWQAQLQED